MTRLPKAAVPEAQTPDYVDEWWILRHQAKLDEVKERRGNIDLVMLGDSITQGWEEQDSSGDLWEEYFVPRNSLNLGFSGDRTEQVLWRLQNGAVDGMKPKLTVLLIGTNNTGHRQDPASETAAGIKANLEELRLRLPEAPTLLLAVFPRGESPTDPLRLINAEINELIVDFADNESVHFLDIGNLFIQPSGMLKTHLMPDELHLNQAGYRIFAEAIEPHLDSLMR